MNELSIEELDAWRQDILTRKVFRKLDERIAEIQEILGDGGTLNHSSAIETLANTARAVGQIEGIREVFQLQGIKTS